MESQTRKNAPFLRLKIANPTLATTLQLGAQLCATIATDYFVQVIVFQQAKQLTVEGSDYA
jgi:hypothetical protein